MAPAPDKPRATPAEMDVLRHVIEHGPSTVRQIADALAEQKGLARTTVMTLMERLRAKGHLRRRPVEGVNVYSLRATKSRLLTGIVGDFVENALGGSLSPFAAYLVERAKLTPKQAAELHALLERIEKEGKP